MSIINKRPNWLSFLLIFFGSGLVALATAWFYDPVGMVTGGFGGIAIITRDLTGRAFKDGGIPLWLTNALLNVPLFFIAFRRHGGKYIARTLLSVLFLSLWLLVLPDIAPVKDDLFLTCIFGGCAMGVGLGMVLICDTTTGGTDMLAVLIHEKISHRFTVGQVMQIIDAVIIVGGIIVFGIKPSLYAIVSVYIAIKITDGILEGANFAKAAFIITDRRIEVYEEIKNSLGRGVTASDCRGMYSGESRSMLLCVVGKSEIVTLRRAVDKADQNAFIIISDVREVFGEGFIETR